MQAVATEDVIKIQRKAEVEPNLNLADRFEQYYPRIYNYLRYRVNSVEDVEDLTGSIFEKAYAQRRRYNPDRGEFSTWLFTIARNQLSDYYRKHKHRSKWETGAEPPVDLVTPEPSPETRVVHQEAIVQLLQGLTQLSERDQEIISLKFAGKLSNIEIGKIMDMKEKTVSVVLLRAVRRLRRQIEVETTL